MIEIERKRGKFTSDKNTSPIASQGKKNGTDYFLVNHPEKGGSNVQERKARSFIPSFGRKWQRGRQGGET